MTNFNPVKYGILVAITCQVINGIGNRVDINKRRNVPCATPSLRVVGSTLLSFPPWEKRGERAQRKVHFFSCFCLLEIMDLLVIS